MGNSTVWWQSKTLIVAAVALIASLAQAKWGIVIDAATQGVILSILMVILRLISTGPVTVTKAPDPVGEAQAYADQTVVTAVKADTAVVNADANVEELKK